MVPVGQSRQGQNITVARLGEMETYSWVNQSELEGGKDEEGRQQMSRRGEGSRRRERGYPLDVDCRGSRKMKTVMEV